MNAEAARGPDLRITPLDRAVAAFAPVAGITFHTVLDFDTTLDVDRLDAAWQRVGRRFPVLRAHADLDAGDTRWRVDRELPRPLVVVEPGTDAEAPWPGPVERSIFQHEPELSAGGLTRLTVVRRGDRHRVVVSGNHALLDGSITTVIEELAGSYRDTAAHDVHACEPPSGEIDVRSRSFDDLLAASGLGRVQQADVLARYLRRCASPLRSEHPMPRSVSSEAGYAAADVTRVLALLDRERRRRGWRTTALLLALLTRAWQRVFDDGEARVPVSGWQMSTDLRVELAARRDGRAPFATDSIVGLGNLSGTELLTLRRGADLERSLGDAIDEAHRELGALSSCWPGLGSALLATRWAALPVDARTRTISSALQRMSSLGYTRSFSNGGTWPASTVDWGPAELLRSFVLPAVSDPGWLVVSIHSVGGRTWMSMRTQTRGVSVDDVTALAAAMIADAEPGLKT